MAPLVAIRLIDAVISCGERSALDSSRAATPATCGLAMDVPLMRAVAPPGAVEVMSTPGAYPSTQSGPQFENHALWSLRSEAAVVNALGARAGDCVQASTSELPAATATKMSAETRSFTAVSSAAEGPPPSDRFTTAGPVLCVRTHSRPAITPDTVPLPEQSSTRTPRSVTRFATP